MKKRNFKNWWEDLKPYWKGGLIGIIIGFIFIFSNYSRPIQSFYWEFIINDILNCFGNYGSGDFCLGLGGLLLLSTPVIFGIIGILLGLIINMIKNYKKNKK